MLTCIGAVFLGISPLMTTPTIKTHESDESEQARGGEICGVCQRQISRYTCPSCNLFYCSLNCFQSELHSRCSETFYRKEVEIGIKSDSSKTERDKNKMVELLKRIEDGAADEDELLHGLDEENEESLASRLSAIDISTAPADDLLRLLTEKERTKFFVALKDPSGGLIRELLESAELDKTGQLPWWDAPCDGGQPSVPQRVPYGVNPDFMDVPANLIRQVPGSFSLLYNICDVLLAYTYVTRHLAISPLCSPTNDRQDRCEARKVLSQCTPFLTDRKSKMLHTSLTGAVVSFWSQLPQENINNKTIIVLLEDVAKLVRPRRIIATGQISGERERAVVLADHPSATTIMAISDVCWLFSNSMDSRATVRRKSHVEMKLAFYAAHILSIPASRLHVLADEVLLLSKRLGEESS